MSSRRGGGLQKRIDDAIAMAATLEHASESAHRSGDEMWDMAQQWRKRAAELRRTFPAPNKECR